MKRWWPNRVPFRLRVFFRGAFLLLTLATLALAVSVLVEEKKLRYRSYRDLFHKNVEQIAARLRHPTGQLALLNPSAMDAPLTPLRPLVLPFSAIDFDDRAKARQAVEMTGCAVQYPDRVELCVGVGNNPSAGMFIYIVGSFDSGQLTEHVTGTPDITAAHRVAVEVAARGSTYRWIAPLETAALSQAGGVHGRLTAFAVDEQGAIATRPNRDFRGWLWQDTDCLPGEAIGPDCRRRTFFSARVPVEVWRDERNGNPAAAWPPHDLDQARVHIEVLPPGDGAALVDSNREGASSSFLLGELRSQLADGEQLRIARIGAPHEGELLLIGREESVSRPPLLVSRLIRRLPVDGDDGPLEVGETVHTPLGDYRLTLSGDVRGLDLSLAVVAARLSWFVAAMLAAILLTWLAIEVRIVRRITLLTRRAAQVRRSVDTPGPLRLDLEGLRGGDELGLLAGVLADLMGRISEDVAREQIRTAQEKDMWHAVGHEIMSPLQSLLALHAEPGDPSRRYIARMQQAVHVLYGSASPSEALLSAQLAVGVLDVRAFLVDVAHNAADAGVADVVFDDGGEAVPVRAQEHSLEDVLSHLLSNADRHRTPSTPITLSIARGSSRVEVGIRNQGPGIAEDRLERIFEYGVTGSTDGQATGNRGQGLFVARTYMAKMGGTIVARNVPGGVEFVLTFVAA